MLTFCMAFKNHVLVDSRIIMLGAHLAKPDDGSESPVDTLDGIYNETANGY